MGNSSDIQIRVRYSETDKMGYVYYGNYATYFEVARVEWLRERGISYKELEDKGILLPVVHMSIDYKKPAFYDDLLTIQVSLEEQPSSKMTFKQLTLNQEGQILNESKVVLVCINGETKRPQKFPEEITGKLFFDHE